MRGWLLTPFLVLLYVLALVYAFWPGTVLVGVPWYGLHPWLSLLLVVGIAAAIGWTGSLLATYVSARRPGFRAWTHRQGEWRLLTYRAIATAIVWIAVNLVMDYLNGYPFAYTYSYYPHPVWFVPWMFSRMVVGTIIVFLLPLGGLYGLRFGEPTRGKPWITFLSQTEIEAIDAHLAEKRRAAAPTPPPAPSEREPALPEGDTTNDPDGHTDNQPPP